MLTADATLTSRDDLDALDLFRLTSAATILDGGEGIQHVLIGDGSRHIRLELRGDSVIQGPVRLSSFGMTGLRRLDQAIPGLRRLVSLWRRGRLPRSLFPRDPRVVRGAMAMQAWDGSRAGATHMQIAAAVYGRQMVGDPNSYDAMRKRVARLIDFADNRMTAGYRRFFGQPPNQS